MRRKFTVYASTQVAADTVKQLQSRRDRSKRSTDHLI